MKFLPLWMSTLAIVIGSGLTRAEDFDTAPHKKLYQEITDKLDEFKKVTSAIGKKEDLIELTGWIEGGAVRKITAKSRGDMTEYYLVDEKPVFVFAVTESSDGGKVEERFYFDGRKIGKWLHSGPNKPVAAEEDMANALWFAVEDYLPALKSE